MTGGSYQCGNLLASAFDEISGSRACEAPSFNVRL
jgi:hypothetical protein